MIAMKEIRQQETKDDSKRALTETYELLTLFMC